MKEKKKIYPRTIPYLKSSLNYIYLVIILYVISYLVSLSFPENFVFFNYFLTKVGEEISKLSFFEYLFYIIWNNLSNAFLIIFSGIFFGVVPFVQTVFNGAIFGYVSANTYQVTGSFIETFSLFAPHGIFELPATFLSFALGIRIGFGFANNYFKFYDKKKFMKILGIFGLAISFFGVIITNYVGTAFSLSLIKTVIFNTLSLLPFIVLLFINKNLILINKNEFTNNLRGSLKVFIKIILPLIIISGVIESIVIYF